MELNYIINKNNDIISFPNGFPNLEKNGDYNIVHQYDEKLEAYRVMQAKLEQLHMWLNVTFENYGKPPLGNKNINKALDIFESDKKQNFIDLITWLRDPTDD